MQFTIPFSHGSINWLFSSSFFRKVVKLEWRKEDIQGLCQAEERVGVAEESHWRLVGITLLVGWWRNTNQQEKGQRRLTIIVEVIIEAASIAVLSANLMGGGGLIRAWIGSKVYMVLDWGERGREGKERRGRKRGGGGGRIGRRPRLYSLGHEVVPKHTLKVITLFTLFQFSRIMLIATTLNEAPYSSGLEGSLFQPCILVNALLLHSHFIVEMQWLASDVILCRLNHVLCC